MVKILGIHFFIFTIPVEMITLRQIPESISFYLSSFRDGESNPQKV